MKKKAFFLPLLAAFALASCSSDEILDNAGGNQPGKFVGDVAYMTVNIQDVNSLTKATVDGGYENGNDDKEDAAKNEHIVSSARFFFFDENGVFVSEASVWNGGTATDPNQNVEYIGNNVIVLENLTETGLPSYLLTVLNAPTFKAAATLEQTTKALTDWNSTLGNEKGKFVMSTASYFGEKTNHVDFADAENGGGARYYATKVNTTDFRKEPATSADNGGVVVYVERLAAKVQLATNLPKVENDLYQVNASVAGNPNDEGSDMEGTTELYVKFLGWGLNATAKQTYLSKQLKEEWNKDNALWGASWNNADDFRSFWAESYIYGKDLKYTSEKDAYLNYVKYSDLKSELGAGVEYCNENTNAPKNILKDITDNLGTTTKAVIPSYTTSVLVKAEICDAEGHGLDLVRYNGLLYKKEQFLQYVLNTIDLGAGNLNVYKYTKVKNTEMNEDGTGTETTKMDWIQVGPADVKLSQKGVDGSNKVRVVSNLKDATESGIEGLKYGYKKDGVMQDFESVEAAETALNNVLSEKKLIGEAFTGGAMYYNIPIEHLAAQSTLNKTNETEGYYGVVRNHWYKLTIDNVANVGHGVFIPEEGSDETERPIIPEEPEDPRYYLGAQINVLSWKVVNQNVGL